MLYYMDSLRDLREHPPGIEFAAGADGALLYRVAQPPEALPPISGRDLACAWERVRSAPRAGPVRSVRFHRDDGSVTDLALADRAARRCAVAAETIAAMRTSYGMSLFLRLLALADLLARLPWVRAGGHHHGGVDRHLLRAAASMPLSDVAQFDEAQLMARLRQSTVAVPKPSGGIP